MILARSLSLIACSCDIILSFIAFLSSFDFPRMEARLSRLQIICCSRVRRRFSLSRGLAPSDITYLTCCWLCVGFPLRHQQNTYDIPRRYDNTGASLFACGTPAGPPAALIAEWLAIS